SDKDGTTEEIFQILSGNSDKLFEIQHSNQLVLIKNIFEDKQCQITVRVSDLHQFYSDVVLTLIFSKRMLEKPKLLTKRIDGYISTQTTTMINLGQLKVKDSHLYDYLYFELDQYQQKYFYLNTISNNQTELWINLNIPTQQTQNSRPLILTANIIVIGLKKQVFNSTDKNIDSIMLNTSAFSNYLNHETKSSFIVNHVDIRLWSIEKEMLERSISFTIQPYHYEQFFLNGLQKLKSTLAYIFGVNLKYVYIYAIQQQEKDEEQNNHKYSSRLNDNLHYGDDYDYDLDDGTNFIKNNSTIYSYQKINEDKIKSIELLISIARHQTRVSTKQSYSLRYLHKKLLFNVIRNNSDLIIRSSQIKVIHSITTSQCTSETCKNNGNCLSKIQLIQDSYYLYEMNTDEIYNLLMPKYKWKYQCLCTPHYIGSRCDIYQKHCFSNPCSSNERCIELNDSYECECIDEPCITMKNSDDLLDENMNKECININSPTCRDSSNLLTFDGYSYVRWKLNQTMPMINATFTFRTQIPQAILMKITTNSFTLGVNIIDGHISINYNSKQIMKLSSIQCNDGLWHDIQLFIDFKLILIRLDHVFNDLYKIPSSLLFTFYAVNELTIGSDLGDGFHGCLGNFTFNSQLIQLKNDKELIHIGTHDGCQLSLELEPRSKLDHSICSLNPCYYGGKCSPTFNSYRCTCLKRFIGKQCQLDTLPCESRPCQDGERRICRQQQNKTARMFDESYGRSVAYTCVSSHELSNQLGLEDVNECLEYENLCPSNTICINTIGSYLCSETNCTSQSCLNHSTALLSTSYFTPQYILITVSTGVVLFLFTLSIIVLFHCRKSDRYNKQKQKPSRKAAQKQKLIVSSPLLLNNTTTTSSDRCTIESPVQTMLKLNNGHIGVGKQQVETVTNGPENTLINEEHNTTFKKMNNFNEKNSPSEKLIAKKRSSSRESLNRRISDPKSALYWSIGNRKMIYNNNKNILPENFLHYNVIEDESTRIPLVNSMINNLDHETELDQYFIDTKNPLIDYNVKINSLSSLTEKLAEQNDIELTQSSNDSNTEEQGHEVDEDENKTILSLKHEQERPLYAKVKKTKNSNIKNANLLSSDNRFRLTSTTLIPSSNKSVNLSPSSHILPHNHYVRTTSILKPLPSTYSTFIDIAPSVLLNGIDSSDISSNNGTLPSELKSTLSYIKQQSGTNGSTTSLFHNANSTTNGDGGWRINPRNLDSLKAKRNSRTIGCNEGEDVEENNNIDETSRLTLMSTRLRHSSEGNIPLVTSDNNRIKLSSFFQTEV
ncbi:unnamed protein product, partial [Didymodactylos carnosus]